MTDKSIDWSTFQLRVNIDNSIEEVFKLFLTPSGWERWFLRQADFVSANKIKRSKNEPIEQNDNYQFRWHGYPDSVIEDGRILEFELNKLCTISFSENAPVSFALSREQNQTIVTLTASEIKTDELSKMNHYVQDSHGWLFYLINLKSMLENGIDLRNKDEKLRNLITA